MIPKSYNEAIDFLGSKNKRTIKSKRATYLQKNGDSVELVYHTTPVVTYNKDNTVKLYSGGYRSLTTKARMNSALGDRGYLYQKNYRWYIMSNGFNSNYFDNVVL